MKRIRLTGRVTSVSPNSAWEQRKQRASQGVLPEPIQVLYEERTLDLAEFSPSTRAFAIGPTGQQVDVSGMRIRFPPALNGERARTLLLTASPETAPLLVSGFLDAASLRYPLLHTYELNILGGVLEHASPDVRSVICGALTDMGYTEYEKSKPRSAHTSLHVALGYLMGAALAPLMVLPISRFLYSMPSGFFSTADDPFFPYTIASVTAFTMGMAFFEIFRFLRHSLQTPYCYEFLSRGQLH